MMTYQYGDNSGVDDTIIFFVNWIKDQYECNSNYSEGGQDILYKLRELKSFYIGRVGTLNTPIPFVISMIDDKIDEVTEMYEMEEEVE
jgi:hypothetical protein